MLTNFVMSLSFSADFLLMILLLILSSLFSQEVPPTPGQSTKEPMFIPVAIGLLDSHGKDMPLSSVYHDGKLESVAIDGKPVHTTVLRVTKVLLILYESWLFIFVVIA